MAADFPTNIEKEPEARYPSIAPTMTDASSMRSDGDDSSPVSASGHGEDDIQALTPQISRAASGPPLSRKATSIGTTGTGADPAFEVDWEGESDYDDPTNWPIWYKGVVIGFISFSTVVVVLYSTTYTTGISEMQADFDIASEPVITLGITVYLIGLAAGSMVLAPISEVYGRRPVYAICMLIFALLIIPCGLATSLQEILICRFFGALAGSAMISNAPGTLNDIVTEDYRALAFSIWSLGPLNGPVLGPIIGGFVSQYLGFRWTNWVVLIMAVVAWVMMMVLKETYPPVLLSKRAAQRRAETDDSRWWCRYEQREPFWTLMRTNLTRPFVMAVKEPICIFWNIYISVIYGIMYMCFVAYPIVYTGLRGWSIGISGLAFSGLGVGATLVIVLEPALRRMINAHAPDPETGKAAPEASVSVVCIAAVLAPIGQLWFAWTCAPPTHWAWSVVAGIPFGAGNAAVFIYSSSYLTGAYGIYTASALAGNAVVRSLLGGTLPLVGPVMYDRLGPHWAGSLLGFAQVAIIPIPLVFYKYGGRIREKSALIARMRADKQRLDGRARRREEKGEHGVLEGGLRGLEGREANGRIDEKVAIGSSVAVQESGR